MKKNPEYGKDSRESSNIRDKIIDLEREMKRHKPAAEAEAQKEIDAETKREESQSKEPVKERVKESKPDPYEYAEDLKRKGMDRQETWTRWVQKTSLNPGMDAKDWYKIFDSV